MYKHCVPMSVDRREVVEVHADHVVVVEWLKPDPAGPYLVMSDSDEPKWAARRFEEPSPAPLNSDVGTGETNNDRD